MMPEVREDVNLRMTGEHRDAVERVITKLHSIPNPNRKVEGKEIGEIIDMFWDEFKSFQTMQPPFHQPHRWNSQDATKGRSWMWHEKYSLPYTSVLGFVACRVTSKTLGIGACERSWGDVKTIKDGKRSHLSGDAIEKLTILYGTALVNEARIRREENDKLQSEGTMFCDEDMQLVAFGPRSHFIFDSLLLTSFHFL